MADRRALVITSPGSIGLQGAPELVPGPGVVERALGLARRGGRVVLLGLAGNGVTARLSIDDVVNNDLRISASFSYTSAAWAEVTTLLDSGRVRLAPLVTHRFPLDAYEEAFGVLRESSGPRGKVILDVNPQDAS